MEIKRPVLIATVDQEEAAKVASLVTADELENEKQQQSTLRNVCSTPRKVNSKKEKNPSRILLQVQVMHIKHVMKALGQRL